jgi:hypothetical protein
MKIATMATMMVMAGMPALAAETEQVRERTVTVCIEAALLGYNVMPRAQAIASEMFAGIGVTIDWRNARAGCPAQVIRISLTDQTPENFRPGAVAYARMDGGAKIRLFYDRISENRPAGKVTRLLAHVLVHEITHILQGIPRHSDRGVMKTRFDERDFTQMAVKPLPFADEDIDLIYRGLEGRAPRAMIAINHAPAMVAAK